MHLSVRAVGWVASCQLAGSALGNLCTLMLGRKLSVRHTLTASLAAAGVANLATLLARDFSMLLVCCLAGGLAGGMAYSVVNAAAARLPRPGVMFAAISIAQMLFGAIGFITLPPLIAAFGPGAIFAILGSYALACAVAAVRLIGPATVHDSGWRASLSLTARGVALLVALFATFLTSTAIWTHLERIGVAARLDTGVISLGLSIGMLAGILGAVAATILLLRDRHPDHFLVGGATLLALSTALLIKAASPAAYLVALCGFNATQSLIVPLYLARLAGESGGDARILVALLAMYLGLIGGPLLGASLVIGLDYQVLILVAAASFAATSFLTFGARRPSMQWVTP
jgi:predicted MFS family arabinose efflux permease